MASALYFSPWIMSSSSSSNNGNRTWIDQLLLPNFLVHRTLPWEHLGGLFFLDPAPELYVPLMRAVPNANAAAAAAAVAAMMGRGGVGAGLGRPGGGGGFGRGPLRVPMAAVAPPPPPPQEAIDQLTAMGFSEERVRQALQASGNNIERAADRLLMG